ncbi:c-type cytochrome domain-containing protein [Zobellia nedashkovskayae]
MIPDLAYAESTNTPGLFSIDPGNPGNSEVVRRILTDDPEIIMPAPASHLNLSPMKRPC